MRILAGAALLLVSLGSLVGCGSSAKAPSFSVVGAKIAERTDAGTVVAIEIKGDNPNRDHVALKEFEYEVVVDGATIFKGVRVPLTTLAGFGVKSFTVPAATSAAVAPGVSFVITGEMRYMPKSAIRETLNDAGWGLPSTPVRGEGVIGS